MSEPPLPPLPHPVNLPRLLTSRYSNRVLQMIPPDITGPPSLLAKQTIIHAFSPRIAVLESSNVTDFAKAYGFDSFLSFLTYFEQALADQDFGSPAIHGSPSRILVHFVPQIDVQIASQKMDPSKTAVDLALSSTSSLTSSLHSSAYGFPELYDQSTYNLTLENHIKDVDSALEKTQFFIDAAKDGYKPSQTTQGKSDAEKLQSSIYLAMLTKALSSNTVVPFESFNHPIINLLAVTSDEDIRHVQETYFNWKKQTEALPTWVDPQSALTVFLILVNSDKPEELQKGLQMQEHLRVNLGEKGIVFPVSFKRDDEQPAVTLYSSESAFSPKTVKIPKKVFESFNIQLQDLLYKFLIPFMQRKIRVWNEQVIAPRKSITGRLLNAGKLWSGSSSRRSFFSFGGSSGNTTTNEPDELPDTAYNPSKGYYNSTAPNVIIRRLADWYFMLRDYKNAYSTYDMLKKDFMNDRAYSYLSSVQEFMIVSLLMGASGKINPLENLAVPRTNGITRKIITDVITPLLDSSFYSYLSRCNLKTYTIRLTLLVAELFFILGQSAAYCDRSDVSTYFLNPEAYFIESQKLFKKLIDSNLVDDTSCAILMERLSYIYRCYGKPAGDLSISQPRQPSYYEEDNADKLKMPPITTFGLFRSRKSILWMLMASKRLDPLVNSTQVALLVWCIDEQLHGQSEINDDSSLVWPYRDESVLHELKVALGNA
ncbi:DEKNAAC102046 [Brettanomyces naardenensis]|uniref:DEKNAAC102046 n=1 Tax=Brettanomyces naardenensis TaxID=13370 RepID=A0A448YJZ2_BRENA|nr:DEKNAAC102046 [Brettanomyces naardenensis]